MRYEGLLFALLLLAAQIIGPAIAVAGDQLYLKQPVESRWASFENPKGVKGGAARENRGTKGHAWDCLEVGATTTLLDVQGSGIIRRIWLTGTPDWEAMRSLRLNMYWDNEKKPAVSVPLADFFGVGTGKRKQFENEFFASPMGTSLNCYIPMPFRKGAKITITNETGSYVPGLFYDIDYTTGDKLDPNAMYFHAHWRRESPTTLGKDFEILPKVKGEGRYLGCGMVLQLDPRYGNEWWGEGEAKVYLDGDKDYPTLAGTGLEDYIGAGYGMTPFIGRYQGCFDNEGGKVGFYRFHVPDPIYFHKDCRVTIQQMGIASRESVQKLIEQKVPLKIVSAYCELEPGGRGKFLRLLDKTAEPTLDDVPLDTRSVLYYRQDDIRTVAYFYLDKPTNTLP